MNRAIILVGGKGERLRPFTEDRPKCMIDVFGNPLLTFQIKLLKKHGFDEITLCCGYRNEVIKDYFGDGLKHDVRLNYAIESVPLGRGGALKNALLHLKLTSEPVLALNGDLLTNIDLSNLVACHMKHRPDATLVSVPLRSPYGIIEIEQDSVVSGFTEKPELPFWINAGIYIMEPKIVESLPEKGDHEELTFPMLAKTGNLRVYKSRAFWKTIDTVKDLTEVRAHFEQLVFGTFLK